MRIKGISAIDQVLRMCWGIAGRSNDERVRLQALAIIDQCNTHKTELITNGSIVSDALKYVNGKTEKLGQQVKAEEEEIEGEQDRNRNKRECSSKKRKV